MTALTALLQEQKVLTDTLAATVAALQEVNRKIEAERVRNHGADDMFYQMLEEAGLTRTTQKLLEEFNVSHMKQLSKADIREDVMDDIQATDESVWQLISRAKTEMRRKKIPYIIESNPRAGYRLVPVKIPDKTLTKKRKNSHVLEKQG